MFSVAPELCREGGILSVLSRKGMLALKRAKTDDITHLEVKDAFRLGSLVAKPIYAPLDYDLLKITFSVLSNLNLSLSEKDHRLFDLNAYENVRRRMMLLKNQLYGLLAETSLKYNEDFSYIINLAEEIERESQCFSLFMRKVAVATLFKKTLFRFSELLFALAKLSPCIVLPNNFIEKDDSTIILAPKESLIEAVIDCCRFLTVSTGKARQVEAKVYCCQGLVTLRLNARADKIMPKNTNPFIPSIENSGIYNYGMLSVRKFIEKAGGKLKIKRKGGLFSVFLSFPSLHFEKVPSDVLDSFCDEDFEPLVYMLKEYQALFKKLGLNS